MQGLERAKASPMEVGLAGNVIPGKVIFVDLIGEGEERICV